MNAQRYLQFIHNDDAFDTMNYQERSRKGDYKESVIRKELMRVRCSLQLKSCQAVFLFLSKTLNHTVDGIHLNLKSLNNIRMIVKDDRKAKIVFVPVYKSYLDPMILHYIHFLHDLELGFTFGNYEDSPKISLVDTLLRRIGTFLVRRNPLNSLSNIS